MAQATRRSRGETVDFTAVSSVNAGDVVLIGNIPMVASLAIAAGKTGTLDATGQFQVAKDTSVFAQGDTVYWKVTGDPVGGTAGSGACTSSATGAKLMGTCVKAALTGDANVEVRLSAAERTTAIAGSVTADDITGSDSTLTVTGIAGSAGSAGGSVSETGGAGHTNGAGGAVTDTGGAGAGSGAGGAVNDIGGVGGATGAGGARVVRGGAGGATSGTGGAVDIDGGAGSGGNANGGAVSIDGGAKNGSGADGAITIGTNACASITLGKTARIPVVAVAAAGSVQGDAGALSEALNVVSAADDTKGVVLPSAVAGMVVHVKSTVSNKILKVWPASGDGINAIAVNSAMSLASGALAATFIAADATTWYSFPLLPS